VTYLDEHAADLRLRGRVLLWVELSTHVYWSSAQTAIFTSAPTDPRQAPAATWTPRGFDAQGVGGTQGLVGGAGSVRVANVDRALSPYFFGSDLRGTPLHLYLALLDPDARDDVNVIDSRSIFDGVIEAAAHDELYVTFTLGPAVDPSRVLMPRRLTSFPNVS